MRIIALSLGAWYVILSAVALVGCAPNHGEAVAEALTLAPYHDVMLSAPSLPVR